MTPEGTRIDRVETDQLKCNSFYAKTKCLRGGDWIHSENKSAMTLSVAWEREDKKKFGMTVYHAFQDDKDPSVFHKTVYAHDTDMNTSKAR